MELVYLWVEDYKNIRNQGFNFSPRFECNFKAEYDENEKLKDNCELKITPKDYVSIFPKNINITAIVGENGSGKSSICGELYSVLKQKELVQQKNKKKFLFLIYDNLDYFSISNISFSSEKDFEKNKFQKFSDFEDKTKKVFFSALGEFSTRENHKGGAFVNSKYSILPLQRAILNNSKSNIIQKNILDKINFFYKNVLINLNKKKGNVRFGNVKLGDLSFGEKYRVLLFSQLFEKLNNDKNSIIFLDEVTLSMHPIWQKEFISDLIQLFKDFNVHFIVSSHSPFILSDIPKENVVFIKKNKDGNCKDITKETVIKTFGANIHTLLSHGFFMDGGLMGEFAKGKINEIIEILKKERLSEDEIKSCKHIISIIGEPILQKL